MKRFPSPMNLKRVKVYPLASRESLSSIEQLLVDPDSPPPPMSPPIGALVRECVERISAARRRDAACLLMFGAHLVKNGALPIVNRLIERDQVTHLATNGAGSIHDWELAFLGRTEESVRKNIATGTFGTWDETGRYIHLALLAGALNGHGYGRSLGQFIEENGASLPSKDSLANLLRTEPTHPLSPARAELLRTMVAHKIPSGRIEAKHPWKATSILAHAFRLHTPLTVHPGIGYDILATHPMFRGAVIGRAADIDFRLLATALDQLDGGVVLSIGSAIMAPQVFEKCLSCVNNLRLQEARPVVSGHAIYVVDLQDGGQWDWSQGEPPKDNPAYYLRFCKSFARMGGGMKYLQCDNVVFLHNLLHALSA